MNCSKNTNFYGKGPKFEYYAPLFAMCQRSGAGKTKSILELGRNYLPVVYIGCSGNSKSSQKAVEAWKNLKMKKDPNVSYHEKGSWAYPTLKLIFALAEFLFEYLEGKKVTDDEFSPEVLAPFVELFFKPSNDPASVQTWDAVMKIISDKYSSNFETILKASKPKNPFFKLKSRYKFPWKLVLAFDEARNLLLDFNSQESSYYSAFEVIRKVANLYSYEMNNLLVIIVADTNSTITNFTPPSSQLVASSSHHRTQHPPSNRLIPPFIQLSGFDSGADDYLSEASSTFKSWKEGKNEGPWISFLEQRSNFSDLGLGFCFLGSPLWRAFFEYTQSCGEENLFAFAAQKMNGGNSLSYSISETSIVAALACRIGLSILPDSMLARNLVASGMAQLNYLTRDRHYGFVGYPSDPTLAEGAAEIMSCTSLSAISVLADHVDRALIDIGMSGEVVARLLIIYAMDRMRSSNSSRLTSYPVFAFFKELLSEKHYTMMEKEYSETPIWNALLFVNHTIFLEAEATLDNIIYAFTRGAMLTGFDQQPSWDICIPVALPNGHLSCVWIQIKDLLESIGRKEQLFYFSKMMGDDLIKVHHRVKLADEEKEKAASTVAQVMANVATLNIQEGDQEESNAESLEPAAVRQKPPPDSLYLLINFRQGIVDTANAGGRMITALHPYTDGTVFIQGSLKEVFQSPSGEESDFDPLLSLLRPRNNYDRIRIHETPLHERKNYDDQDHAHTRCVLIDPKIQPH